jgi:hypothetical protein
MQLKDSVSACVFCDKEMCNHYAPKCTKFPDEFFVVVHRYTSHEGKRPFGKQRRNWEMIMWERIFKKLGSV